MTAKEAMERLTKEMQPMARQVKNFALESSHWIRAGSLDPVTDQTLRDKHSCQFGDIICTYVVEDHGQLGIWQILTVQFLTDFFTLPKVVVDKLVELFFEEGTTDIRIKRQPALASFKTGTEDKLRPIYELWVAIAPYKKGRIITLS